MSMLAFDSRASDLVGVKGEILGISVLVVMSGNMVVAVGVDSIKMVLGVPEGSSLAATLRANALNTTVQVDGSSKFIPLLPLEAFFKFCMMHPSPRVNLVRDKLAEMARSVQQNGSYIDPSAGPKAYIPRGMEDNPVVQMCSMIMDHEVQMERLGGEVRSIRGEIEGVRESIGRGLTEWTVMAWVDYHGFKITSDEAKKEGMVLRKICDRRGFSFSEEKVCNGGNFAARKWPMEAIRIWWPECCRRRNWAVHWKVQ